MGGVFGGDAALEGGAVDVKVVLGGELHFGPVEVEAEGDLDLGADDVDAGDFLGDGVFDLDAGVDFDEEPLAGVGIDEEFDGAGAGVTGGAAKLEGGLAEAVADFGGESDGGGDFDDFLVAALDGAVAFVEVEEVAVAVAEELDFDVAGAADVAFEEDGAVAEGGFGFGGGFGEAGFKFGWFEDDAHAASAAAESGFQDEGEADLGGDLAGFFEGFDGVSGTGEDGDAGLLGEAAGGGFVAEVFEDAGIGADEGDAGGGAGAGEGGIFAEETVAGVDEVDLFFAGEGDDAGDIEVGLDGPETGAGEVGFVGFEAMEGEAVLLAVDGDGTEAQLVGGTEDADSNFAAVEGQKLLGHLEIKVAWAAREAAGFE